VYNVIGDHAKAFGEGRGEIGGPAGLLLMGAPIGYMSQPLRASVGVGNERHLRTA